MKTLRSIVIMITVGTVSLFCCMASPVWQINEIVTPHLFTKMSPDSLAIDSNGYPVVAYGGDGLYLVRYNGQSWQYETLDTSWNVGEHACLKLDQHNVAHVVYSAWVPETHYMEIKYARQSGETWQIESLPNTRGASDIFGMALDSSGDPWIVYFHEDSDTVEILTPDGSGGWNRETLFMSLVDITRLDIALNGDTPYVAYIAEEQLKLAYDFGSGFNTMTVDAVEVYSEGLDLEVESSGFVHLVYQSDDQKELRYSTFEPEGWPWIPEIIESGTDYPGRYPSLVLNPVTQDPVVSYLKHDSEYHIRLASKTGSSWSFRDICSDASYFLYTSAGVDSSGDIHVSYYQLEDNQLHYTRVSSGTPETTVLDRSRDYNFPVCATMNSAGNLSIFFRNSTEQTILRSVAYHEGWRSGGMFEIGLSVQSLSADETPGTVQGVVWTATSTSHRTTGILTFTELTSSGWQSETVDPMPVDFNVETELKYDGQGRPHILYLAPGPILTHAVRDNGFWSRTTVIADSVRYYSLDIADDGTLHAAFIDPAFNLYHAQADSSFNWTTEIIHTDSVGLGKPRLKVDNANKPVICYMDPDDGVMRYFQQSGSQWTSELISEIGSYSDAQFDFIPVGNSPGYIVWRDHTVSHLRLARQETPGSAWEFSTMDSQMSGAYDITLLLDPMNRLNVTYYDLIYGRIYHATLQEPVWYDLGMPDTDLYLGDTCLLTRRIHNTTSSVTDADEYVILDVFGEFWFAPDWDQTARSISVQAAADSVDYEEILSFSWPPETGTLYGIRFWGGLVESGTSNLIDYDMVEFGWYAP